MRYVALKVTHSALSCTLRVKLANIWQAWEQWNPHSQVGNSSVTEWARSCGCASLGQCVGWFGALGICRGIGEVKSPTLWLVWLSPVPIRFPVLRVPRVLLLKTTLVLSQALFAQFCSATKVKGEQSPLHLCVPLPCVLMNTGYFDVIKRL